MLSSRRRTATVRHGSRLSGVTGSFAGMFAFVLISLWALTETAITVNGNIAQSGIAKLVIVAAFVLAHILGMIVAGPDGQINPALTAGLAIRHKKFSLLINIPVQFFAAWLATWFVRLWFGAAGDTAANFGAATPVPVQNYFWTVMVVIFVEALGTSWLARTSSSSASLDNQSELTVTIATSLVLGAGIMLALNITGGAFNPARWFGPAAWSGTYTLWAAYLIGQFSGGILGTRKQEHVADTGAAHDPATPV